MMTAVMTGGIRPTIRECGMGSLSVGDPVVLSLHYELAHKRLAQSLGKKGP